MSTVGQEIAAVISAEISCRDLQQLLDIYLVSLVSVGSFPSWKKEELYSHLHSSEAIRSRAVT